jgi:cobalt-zinc-cadmium efflux system membrane fusion protein
MNEMKNILILATILLSMQFIVSCGDKKSKDDTESVKIQELPPSLRSVPDSVKLIRLSEKEQSELNIRTVTIQSSRIDYPLSAPGVVFNDPGHTSIISAPIDGQVSEINKKEGEWVRKGQELFRIQSLDFGTMVSDYLIAYAEEKYQSGRLDRIRQLVNETISSESQLEQAKSDHNRAGVNLRASYSRLKAIGVSDREIESFTTTEDIDPVFKIYSPIEGVVEINFVEPGQSVNALENLSRIVDNRIVLIRGYLNPDDARLVQEGDRVTISRREDRTMLLEASVASVNPGLDENSMSVIVNIYTPASAGWPKPGENVHLSILTRAKEDIIVIPFESLTYDGENAVVFVNKGNGVYEKRTIQVLDIGQENVFVRSGLSQGEEVAVTQVFSLKALSRFDIIAEE